MRHHAGHCGKCHAFVPEDRNHCPMCGALYYHGLGPIALIFFIIFGLIGLVLAATGGGMLFYELTGPARQAIVDFELVMLGVGAVSLVIAWAMPRTRGRWRGGN